MPAYDISRISEVVTDMDFYMRNSLLKRNGVIQSKKLWENTYIRHQIEKRKKNGEFSLSDHIRGMVYSMLTSGISWERIESGIDESTGRIYPIDEIFHQFAPDYLMSCSPESLEKRIKELHFGSRSTGKQMDALVRINIPKLIALEKKFGSVDSCYQEFIQSDNSLKLLVRKLSDSGSDLKMAQMGEALVAEYLRNVGYDIAKPDRHIRRILGKDILGCSKKSIVPIYEAMDIVKEIAVYLGKDTAEVDYILWMYCAKGYGEICIINKTKCKACVAKEVCNQMREEL